MKTAKSEKIEPSIVAPCAGCSDVGFTSKMGASPFPLSEQAQFNLKQMAGVHCGRESLDPRIIIL